MTGKESNKLVDIRIFGIGGGGNNAVVRMCSETKDLSTVEHYIINTDKQALETEEAKILGNNRMCIGQNLTKGLGAGANPDMGRKSAEENKEEIMNMMKGADLVFVAAGMGGGTGTGAAPVVASIAKELGILTVGIVTKPFSFEGKQKARNAEAGIKELEANCDTLIAVPNDKLLTLEDKKISMIDAFKKADNILKQSIRGISDLIVYPGLINTDFSDIANTLRGKLTAHIGIGIQDTILDAMNEAVDSPLLETSINGATGLLINFASGKAENLSLFEVNEAASLVEERCDENVNIIFGTTIDESLGDDKVKVTVIATGFEPVVKEEVAPTQKALTKEAETKEAQQISSELNEIPSFLIRR